MLSLARNGFSAELVDLALRAAWGSRVIDFRYELYDKNGNKKADLTTVESASVSHDALADIKRKAQFTIRDDNTINFISDRIKPYVRLWIPPGKTLRQWYYLQPWQTTEEVIQQAPEEGGWVEFSLGVFLLSSPKRSVKNGVVFREVEAYDQNKILQDDKVDGKYLIPAGTKFTTAIQMVLESAGITKYNITPSDKVLPVDREWDVGTTKLQIINDLLEALNYNSIWFDGEGYAVAAPYVLPAQSPSEYTYEDGELGVIVLDSPEHEADLFSVPNKWVLIVSQPDRPVLKSVYVNDNPASPTSTVSRGWVYMAEPKQVDAADQETLDALVRRWANEDTTIFETITWQSWLMPMHTHMDNYTLKYTPLGINGKYREISWSMELKESGVMTHTCRRSITV